MKPNGMAHILTIRSQTHGHIKGIHKHNCENAAAKEIVPKISVLLSRNIAVHT